MFSPNASLDSELEIDAAGQYLTFILAGEEYAVEILKVQEIKGWEIATPIPNTPEYILGVLNLRGAVVPIVDLRLRFGLEEAPYNPTTVIIVVKVRNEEQERTVGFVVDAVADVYRLEADQIQSPPEMSCAVESDYLHGLATVQEKMVILLDIDSLADFDSVDALSGMGGMGNVNAPIRATETASSC
ncbi:MAG: chemotaxis protein CheW [Pseudomonadota bacterium]